MGVLEGDGARDGHGGEQRDIKGERLGQGEQVRRVGVRMKPWNALVTVQRVVFVPFDVLEYGLVTTWMNRVKSRAVRANALPRHKRSLRRLHHGLLHHERVVHTQPASHRRRGPDNGSRCGRTHVRQLDDAPALRSVAQYALQCGRPVWHVLERQSVLGHVGYLAFGCIFVDTA